MKLTHWCARQFELADVCYLQKIDMKPAGLWFDVDDDWRRWIEDENMLEKKWANKHFHYDPKRPLKWYGRTRNPWRKRLKFCYDVQIVPDMTGILRLSTPEQLDRFTKRFVAMPPELLPYANANPKHLSKGRLFQNMFIDWPAVAKKYKGIIIHPYVYQRRMELLWYYGWDCASGMVWDTSRLRLTLR